MFVTPHRTRVRHHRSLLHPRRAVYRVPVEHVTSSVAVPVRKHVPPPPRKVPEWRTETWKHRVEAEAVHGLEHRLRGLGRVR